MFCISWIEDSGKYSNSLQYLSSDVTVIELLKYRAYWSEGSAQASRPADYCLLLLPLLDGFTYNTLIQLLTESD